MNLWVIFLTGLTTGGLTCLAVQGGLLTSVIATQKSKELGQPTPATAFFSFDRLDWLPVGIFLVAKLLSHTLLGFFLGALGSVVTLSVEARLFFQAFSAFFMFATAMNLLHVHPIFRYISIQPPKFVTRFIRRFSKEGETLFAPAILGFLTVLIPCGVTQAMEVLAIGTANPAQGALLMATFVIGTSPLFAFVGLATAKFSEGLRGTFLKISAGILIVVSLISLNGVLEVINAPFSFSRLQNGWTSFWTPNPSKRNQALIESGVQKVTIAVSNQGYSPNFIRVKKGIPVELTLRTDKAYTCAVDFTLRSFGIREFLNPTDSRTVRFTPQQTGRFTYACSMGMYTGILEVN